MKAGRTILSIGLAIAALVGIANVVDGRKPRAQTPTTPTVTRSAWIKPKLYVCNDHEYLVRLRFTKPISGGWTEIAIPADLDTAPQWKDKNETTRH